MATLLTLGELPAQQSASLDANEGPRAERDRDYDQPRRNFREDRRGNNDRTDRRGGGDRDRPSNEGPRLGLSLAPAGNEPGVVIAEVDPSGPAANFGFRPGDVILDVAGKTVSTPADVRTALSDARGEGKRSILMRIKSDRGTRFVAVPLDRA